MIAKIGLNHPLKLPSDIPQNIQEPFQGVALGTPKKTLPLQSVSS